MLVLQAENERQQMASRLTILPYRVMIMLCPRWMINGWLQVLKAEGRELHLPPRAFVMKPAPLDITMYRLHWLHRLHNHGAIARASTVNMSQRCPLKPEQQFFPAVNSSL
jgi:hypothetical protein